MILNEEFFNYAKIINYIGDTKSFFIYKNPTISEWNKYVAISSRGYIDPEGNAYFEGYEDIYEKEHTKVLSNILHYDLAKGIIQKHQCPYLENLGINFDGNPDRMSDLFYKKGDRVFTASGCLIYGTMVQRIDESFSMRLSESLYNIFSPSSRNLKILIKRFKEKNPSLFFNLD